MSNKHESLTALAQLAYAYVQLAISIKDNENQTINKDFADPQ